MTEQPTALARLVAYLTGGFFLIYGASFALSPNAMLGLVTQYEIAGSSALVDFRATYGGLQLAVGVLILYLFQGGQVRTSLIASAAILFTMALFRSIGLASDGPGNVLMWVYLSLEIGGGLLAIVALRGVARA